MTKSTNKKDEIKYTKYEKARIIGSRSLQIAMGAPILVKFDEDMLKSLRYNPVEIAKLEFKEDVIPITVKRPAPRSSGIKKED